MTGGLQRERSWHAYRDLPRAVHLLCLGTLINRAGTFLIPFLAIYMRDALGLPADVATRAIGALGLGSIVASLAGGALADRIGRRTVMLFGLIGSASVLLVFGSLHTPAAVMTAAFCFSLLGDMYRPAASAMLADLVEPARRGHAFGLMYVAVNLGFTIGAAVGGVVALYSFQWLFWGDAMTSCAYAVIILVVIRETLPGVTVAATAPAAARALPPARAAGSSGGEASQPAPSSPTLPTDAGSNYVSLRDALSTIARDRVFLLYVLAMFLSAMVFMQFMSSLPLYMRSVGITTDRYGLIVGLNGAMIVVLQLPVTSFLTRFDRGRVLALSALLTGIGFGLMGFATQVWQLTALVVLMTVAEMMQAPLMQAVVGDLAPPALRGRYMGALSVCFASAVMIGGPLGGWTLTHLGAQVLWGSAFIFGTASAVILLVMRAQLVVRHEPVEVAA